MNDAKIAAVQSALERAWGPGSSTLWTPERPVAGHCGVSTLVAHDHLGGEILKTRYGDLWHFYNLIEGQRIDFTECQFDAPIVYDDVPSDRQEAFADTNDDQYRCLSGAVARHLGSPDTVGGD
ncbi:MAG: hypothetical protein AAF415_06520 [Pseudomonadota bacterium]